ncbi:MAG: cyclic nucleotide-binding domain-containing protein [Litoreibacter sp.]
MARHELYSDDGDIDFSEQEQAFLDGQLPTLPRSIARTFLDSVKWVEESKGHFLTLEGEENHRLIYLIDGDAAITLKGQLIGRCPEGSFVGEMTALDGGAATATAMLLNPTRYISIRSAELKRLCMANPELRIHLERAFALDTRKKLLASNEALRQS